MSLATIEKNGQMARYEQPQPVAFHPSQMSFDDIIRMAEVVVNSRMFPGIRDVNQACTLMMICQADGLHPMVATRRYHFFNNSLTTRSDWALARFIRRGGKMRWIDINSPTKCSAHFSHKTNDPEGFELTVTVDDFKHLTSKANWKESPKDMLRARIETKGIKMIDPGVFAGVPTADEIEDRDTFDTNGYVANPTKVVDVEVSKPPQAADVPVFGWRGIGHDTRSYLQVAKEAASEFQSQIESIYAANKLESPKEAFKVALVHPEIYKLAFAAGKTVKPATSTNQTLAIITEDIYPVDRQWVRETLTAHLGGLIEKLEADFEIAAGDGETEGRMTGEDG